MRKNIFTSFVIVSLFSVLDRALGFLFKIYLSRNLGAESMGVYQVAIGVFFVLLTFVSAGIPLIVSRSVAGFIARGDHKSAGKTTASALIVGVLSSAIIIVVTVLVFPIIRLFTGDEASLSIALMLPSLLFSAVYGALRGHLWGQEKYLAVSLVEIIEQVGRIGSCVIMLALGVNGTIASSLSLSVGCAFSAVACMIFFTAFRNRLYSPKGHTSILIKSSLPITLSRTVSTLFSSALSIAVPALFIFSGHDSKSAMSLYGASMGMAMPLLFAPMTLIGSLAFVLVPTLSADKKSNTSYNQSKIYLSIAVSSMLACAFIPLFSACGLSLGELVYDNEVSGRFMQISAWIILPLSLKTISSSALNSLDLENKSLINSLIAYLAQAIFYFTMRNGFTLQVLSLGIGVELCIATLLNLVTLTRKSDIGLKWSAPVVKSVLAVLPSNLLARSLLPLLGGLPEIIAIALSGGAGAIAFLLLALVFDVLPSEFLKAKSGVFRRKKTKENTTYAIDRA